MKQYAQKFFVSLAGSLTVMLLFGISVSLSFHMTVGDLWWHVAGGLIVSLVPSAIAPVIIKKNDVVMMIFAQSFSILTACYFWLKAWS